MKLCTKQGCEHIARWSVGYVVWASKADKLKGQGFGVTGQLLEVVVCDDHVPEQVSEFMTDEGKMIINKALQKIGKPWPKWSTAEVMSFPL